MVDAVFKMGAAGENRASILAGAEKSAQQKAIDAGADPVTCQASLCH